MDLTPPTLTGKLVRLEPLTTQHHDGLLEATKDGQMWDRWYTGAPSPERVQTVIDERLAMQATGKMVPFATVRLSDNAVLGITTFYDIEPSVPRVSIGYTWNRESAHGTGTNPDSKLLLMTYAFEVWNCAAVRYETSWSNQQSRAAIARLGARQDGVLRADSREHTGGGLRDTVVFSILAHEWPSVKTGLQHRLRHR